MLEEKNYTVSEVREIWHPDGWGYKITSGEENFTISYFDENLPEKEFEKYEIEISTLLIRPLVENLLAMIRE